MKKTLLTIFSILILAIIALFIYPSPIDSVAGSIIDQADLHMGTETAAKEWGIRREWELIEMVADYRVLNMS